MNNMPPENFFRALADQTRLRCLVLILQTGEECELPKIKYTIAG
jgi:hypothetical protein